MIVEDDSIKEDVLIKTENKQVKFTVFSSKKDFTDTLTLKGVTIE